MYLIHGILIRMEELFSQYLYLTIIREDIHKEVKNMTAVNVKIIARKGKFMAKFSEKHPGTNHIYIHF